MVHFFAIKTHLRNRDLILSRYFSALTPAISNLS